eukprot:742149_1
MSDDSGVSSHEDPVKEVSISIIINNQYDNHEEDDENNSQSDSESNNTPPPYKQSFGIKQEQVPILNNEIKPYQRPKKKNKIKLFISSIIGAIFNGIIGALLHFTFEWFDCWQPIGAFMPINESFFEHLKMNYWPIIWYAFIEYPFINNPKIT